MNTPWIKGKWHELKGTIKEEWGDLTDNDLTEVDGRREQLLGKIQQRYGKTRLQVERELDHWEDKHGLR